LKDEYIGTKRKELQALNRRHEQLQSKLEKSNNKNKKLMSQHANTYEELYSESNNYKRYANLIKEKKDTFAYKVFNAL
jgi:peptidoglycan hydrolase CwlO-like protein